MMRNYFSQKCFGAILFFFILFVDSSYLLDPILGKAKFEVVPGDKYLIITTPIPEEPCPTLKNEPQGDPYKIGIYDLKTNVSVGCTVYIWCGFPYTCKNLTINLKYKVDIYFQEKLYFNETICTTNLSRPEIPDILGSKNVGKGLTSLSWRQQMIDCKKIREFRISAYLISTELRYHKPIENPIEIRYPVEMEENIYSTDLPLLSSTKYRIKIIAINRNNLTSDYHEINVTVSDSVAFEKRDDKLEVIEHKIPIKIKTPSVVNATKNTRVNIIVEEIKIGENIKSQDINRTKLIAFDYLVDKSNPEFLIIDCNQTRNIVGKNCTLNFGKTYVIRAMLKIGNASFSQIFIASSPITLTEDTSILTWLIISLIPLIILSFFIWYRYRRNKIVDPMSQGFVSTFSSTTMTSDLAESTSPHGLNNSARNSSAENCESAIKEFGNRGDGTESWNYSHDDYSVEVRNFENFVKESMASGLLFDQFMSLSIGRKKNCKYGKIVENREKNKFKNIIPYDDTRVILKKIPGDNYSDYINASHIKGYRKEKAYIATQTPMANTVNDFFRMIWQEKVRVICMLTNGEETSSEQYWPEIGNEIKYGDIRISNIEHQVFADYTLRKLIINYNDSKRQITHLHYTEWPDNGVPMHTQSLVAYVKKLLATPSGKGPIVVHCNDGIGPTGTIVLCDICLRKAVREKIFAVRDLTIKIREDRKGMVENIQQYFFAHLIIMEIMISELTQIPCSNELPKRIEDLKKRLHFDCQRLEDVVWQDRALHSLAETRTSILEYGYPRSPLETHAVHQFVRNSTFESESNYINAVSIDGVRMKQAYLESQLPTIFTLSEYWRLIAQKRVELVLVLQPPSPNDPNCCNIISDSKVHVPSPFLKVEIQSDVDRKEHFIKHRLLLTDISEGKPRQQPVTVLTCTEWKIGKTEELPSTASLVSLWMASEKISRKKTQTLVLCHDGVTGCGLYLALSFLLERMAVEKECDVISAVRAVRRSRTEFVQSSEQFLYLYDAAVHYFESFQTYSNFL